MKKWIIWIVINVLPDDWSIWLLDKIMPNWHIAVMRAMMRKK